MKLSIVVATNRDAFWRRFCDALVSNAVPLEVLFVGPNGAGEPGLPVPARFIDVPDVTVGAARCWEIGARAATGDLLCLAADDVVYSPGFFDVVAAEASKPHDPHDMFTALYLDNGSALPAQTIWCVPGMPLLPVCGVVYTETHHAMGGIDKRFHDVYWDADLYMHLHQLSGRTVMLEGHTCHEQGGHGLWGRSQGPDGVVLHALWPTPLSAEMKRTSERQRWEDYVS